MIVFDIFPNSLSLLFCRPSFYACKSTGRVLGRYDKMVKKVLQSLTTLI